MINVKIFYIEMMLDHIHVSTKIIHEYKTYLWNDFDILITAEVYDSHALWSELHNKLADIDSKHPRVLMRKAVLDSIKTTHETKDVLFRNDYC